MKSRLQTQTDFLAEDSLRFLAGCPVVYHCHHFNLFLDQTVDDALGVVEGTELRALAAMEAHHELLSGLVTGLGVQTPGERLELATELFKEMGQGTLSFEADETGGRAHGTHLHYGLSWNEKYGGTIRRRYPTDAFAAGYAAAALTVAYDLPFGTIRGHEESCVAMRQDGCEILLTAGHPEATYVGCHLDDIRDAIMGPCHSPFEQKIQSDAARIRRLHAGMHSDARGVARAFGVLMTQHPATYYNRITAGAIAHVTKIAPRVLPVVEELLRESGHVCVFNTFGGIMISPEWEGVLGDHGDSTEVVCRCVSIARALGFGRWVLVDFDPGERLVLRSSVNYESAYCLHRSFRPERGASYFMQGAALAIMQLATRVDWTGPVALTHEFYLSLFKRRVPWRVEQTQCTARGDQCDEVVVSKR